MIKDLIILVADKDMKLTMEALLNKRYKSIGVRRVSFDIFSHPNHDPGVRLYSGDFLRKYCNDYKHALVLFDRHGCGDDNKSVQELQESVQYLLDNSGWSERSAVVVIDPELEAWVFSKSRRVADIIAKGDGNLVGQVKSSIGVDNNCKPINPKKALLGILRQKNIPRSSSLYRKIAENVGLQNCKDKSFERLCNILREWFSCKQAN
jgi:hypothetical protein